MQVMGCGLMNEKGTADWRVMKDKKRRDCQALNHLFNTAICFGKGGPYTFPRGITLTENAFHADACDDNL